MIKILCKLGMEGNILKGKGHIQKDSAGAVVRDEELNAFPPNQEEDRVPSSISKTPIRQEKEIKGTQIIKEKVKLFPSAYDINFYVEDPKRIPEKSVKANKFSKVGGYKMKTQKSFVLSSTNNEIIQK